MSESDQRVDAGLGLDDDASTITAIASAGTASRDVLLATKRHATVTTSTSDDFDFDAVDKHVERLRFAQGYWCESLG
jgi:hypothetical protein